MASTDIDMDELIDQMDKSLGRYYKQLNRTDYFNEQGIGKFKEYCDVNSFDDIPDEMEVPPDENMLIDFDDEFPFPNNHEPEDRQQAIFEVLNKCMSDPSAYQEDLSFAAFKVSARNFEIEEKERDEMLMLYKTECSTVWNAGFENDKSGSLLNLLFIGTKLRKPYLQLLADMYARDRLKAYNKDPSNKIKIIEWANKNRHMLKLKQFSDNQRAWDMVISGIRLWYKRILPLMMLKAQIKIVDDLEAICEYINQAVDMVWNLAKVSKSKSTQNKPTCPFQYDFCIAFNFVTMDSDAHTAVPDDGDYTNVHDVDSEDELKENTFYDCIGNVKKRLSDKKIKYHYEKLENDERRVGDYFKEFSETTTKQKKDKKYTSKNEYPRQVRFCSLIDRRKPIKIANNDNTNKDIQEEDEVMMLHCFYCVFYCCLSLSPLLYIIQLLFWEPPQSDFPEDFKVHDLWYFNSSKSCIIPETKNYKEDSQDKERLTTQTVNTEVPCKGAFMVLSFHVTSADEIRAYLYINGQMIRFFPKDLRSYLPQYFKQTEENKAYAQSEDMEILIKNMEQKLIDRRFKAWYKEYMIPDR